MKLARFQDKQFRSLHTGIVLGEEGFDYRIARQVRPSLKLVSGMPPLMLGMSPFSSMLPEICEALQRLPPDQFPQWRHPLAEVELLAPIEPPSFRDFYAFEEHVRNARRRR